MAISVGVCLYFHHSSHNTFFRPLPTRFQCLKLKFSNNSSYTLFSPGEHSIDLLMRLHQLASNRSVSAPCCIDRSQEWIFSRSTIAKVAGNYLWKLRRLTSRNYKLLRDRANKLSLFHAAVRADRARVQRHRAQVSPVLCLLCFVIQDLLLFSDSYSTPGEDLLLLDE